ncbi:MAG: TOBE domain-containing protein, partial [Pseudomonadota bacterium]
GSPSMNLLPGEVVGTGEQTTIKMASGLTAVSAVPTTDADMGLKVNVGVRPEDFVATDAGGIYTGKVDFTEALGEVTILYFEAEDGKEPVLAKMAGIHPGLRGQTVTVGAAPEKVQLFADGKSLYYR